MTDKEQKFFEEYKDLCRKHGISIWLDYHAHDSEVAYRKLGKCSVDEDFEDYLG